jgi:cell wall-associated NlpC family hydrolase
MDISRQTGLGIARQADKVFEMMERKPYKYGGKSLDGFDCSGFVAYVFQQLFPERKNTFAMSVAGYMKSPDFYIVDTPQPGDLIVFRAHSVAPYQGVNHIGIVQNEFGWIGSQSSTGVAFVLFSDKGYWAQRPKFFLRYKHHSVSTALSYHHSFA